MLWQCKSNAGDGNDLIDWHGKVLFENVYGISVSKDGRYVLIQREWGNDCELYGVNGAKMEEAN